MTLVRISFVLAEMHNARNIILLIIIFTLNKDCVNDVSGDDGTPGTSKALDLGRISFVEFWLGGVGFRVLLRQLENQLGHSTGVCLWYTHIDTNPHTISLNSLWRSRYILPESCQRNVSSTSSPSGVVSGMVRHSDVPDLTSLGYIIQSRTPLHDW